MNLLKQLLGAAVGTLVAVIIYGAYNVAAPRVAAMLFPASDTTVISLEFTDANREENQQQIIERAKENLRNGSARE